MENKSSKLKTKDCSYQLLLEKIGSTLQQGRENAILSINRTIVITNWKLANIL